MRQNGFIGRMGMVKEVRAFPSRAAGGAPVAENGDMRVVVQPPVIPPRMGMGDRTVYGDLMKKHDRMGSRHIPGVRK